MIDAVSYSFSLWERARVRARSVEKKKVWGGVVSLCSLIPHPQPSPKGRGRLEDSDLILTTDKVLAYCSQR